MEGNVLDTIPYPICKFLFTALVLGAVCICKMFDVKKTITATLIGAVVVTFPTVTSVLTYNYVSDGYALSFLLSCIAAMLIVGKKPKYIVSAVCIALSSGIYQAYVTVTILLLLCYLILEGLREESTVPKLLTKSVKMLLTGIAGMALYYILTMVILKIMGAELLEYQGINNAAAFSGINILGALYNIKSSFVDYFFDFSSGISVFTILNCVVFALTVILYLVDIVKNRTSLIKLLLTIVYVIFLPIGASVLAFINSDVDYHNLMKMGFFVFYLFLILQYERSGLEKSKFNTIKAWAIFCTIFVLVFNNIIIANVSYHKLNMAYEKSYGTLIRIADRIEQTEGAEECDRILVIGALRDSEAYSVKLPPDMTGTTDGYILRADDEIVGQSVLCSALNDYCGKNYTFLACEEKEALLSKLNMAQIGVWPESDSILVSDGVIIISLGNEVQ